jgi:hypothetical protein
MRKSSLLLVLALVACASDKAHENTPDTASSPSTAQSNRCAPEGTSITTGGVGVVQVGARMHDVKAACSVTDTSVTLGEGMQERAHSVNVGGGTVVALSTGTVDTSVTRVIVGDGRYTTEKGIGVGKTIGALKQAYGALCEWSDGGKPVYQAASLPGVSFGIDSLRAPADSTPIAKIWVIGNPPRCVAK